ncbi:MAG: lipoprotein [Gammaproteobacteria bacterium]
MRSIGLILILLCLSTISACGIKGPLTLPDENGTENASE